MNVSQPVHTFLCKVMDQCNELLHTSEMLSFSEEHEWGGGCGTGKTPADPYLLRLSCMGKLENKSSLMGEGVTTDEKHMLTAWV